MTIPPNPTAPDFEAEAAAIFDATCDAPHDVWIRNVAALAQQAFEQGRGQRWQSVAEALSQAEEYLDCGDNSCLFKKSPGGMRTNGGCRCAQRPFVNAALAALVKAVRAALQSPPESTR